MRKSQLIERIKNLFLNVLFPKECVNCFKEGSWVCQSCLANINISNKFVCPSCNGAKAGWYLCGSCRVKGYPLDSLIFVSSYRDKIIQKLIHLLKYNYCEEVSSDLSKIMLKFFNKYVNAFPKVDLIASVPLHKNRLQKRGFNQSEVIGKKLAEILQVEFYDDILIRIKQALPQVELARSERLTNVLGSFLVTKRNIDKKNILLVDDVYTTGATLKECARVLKNAGAREVHGFVIARG